VCVKSNLFWNPNKSKGLHDGRERVPESTRELEKAFWAAKMHSFPQGSARNLKDALFGLEWVGNIKASQQTHEVVAIHENVHGRIGEGLCGDKESER
jgi:hypothetical protein